MPETSNYKIFSSHFSEEEIRAWNLSNLYWITNLLLWLEMEPDLNPKAIYIFFSWNNTDEEIQNHNTWEIKNY